MPKHLACTANNLTGAGALAWAGGQARLIAFLNLYGFIKATLDRNSASKVHTPTHCSVRFSSLKEKMDRDLGRDEVGPA
ncbi:MAG TPA: hypothetical protein VJP83_01585, partial [Terriglobales bacterium]|nr:hypothetical protein [Terriglobales bacterium]